MNIFRTFSCAIVHPCNFVDKRGAHPAAPFLHRRVVMSVTRTRCSGIMQMNTNGTAAAVAVAFSVAFSVATHAPHSHAGHSFKATGFESYCVRATISGARPNNSVA